MEKIDQTVFYSIEKAIKSYRQFAQRRVNANGFDITVDQGLVLRLIYENPDIKQQEIAQLTFKDHASITRIIDSLVTKKILDRDFHSQDRRRFSLSVTTVGIECLTKLEPIVALNRTTALKGISKEELNILNKLLNKISQNCQ